MDSDKRQKTAIIFGAGPAGLTAAYELLTRTNIKPIIYELTQDMGGISKTVVYKGNRIDIGGHRFFSKSKRVLNWWLNILPLQETMSGDKTLSDVESAPEIPDKVMLIRSRLSRILFERKFYDYPISLKWKTLSNLGIKRIFRMGLSYAYIRLFPIKKENSLEDFFINRFGKELYKTFFKDYTHKVWGVPCDKIAPEWGAQRVKGLSVTTVLLNAIRKILNLKHGPFKKIETSLIEKFYYPKYGPGQLWEEVAHLITKLGGEICCNAKISTLTAQGNKILSATIIEDGTERIIEGDYFFSSIPVKDLMADLKTEETIPDNAKDVAKGLIYRDFLTVGMLLKKWKNPKQHAINEKMLIKDNWIYIQETDVKLGRIQIFNNWSPYMVKDPDLIWIGLEYFCNEGEQLWMMDDTKLSQMAAQELEKLNLIDPSDLLDSVVIRIPKAYPAYFGTYKDFNIVKNFLDCYENLFLIGRNGTHRYNNMDHSMLTAMLTVDNILAGQKDKSNIWAVNTENEYHDDKV